jgi:hypothetical protein
MKTTLVALIVVLASIVLAGACIAELCQETGEQTVMLSLILMKSFLMFIAGARILWQS